MSFRIAGNPYNLMYDLHVITIFILQDSIYHRTSHSAGQHLSQDVTQCRTASITGRHTVQDSIYHWTSHRARQRIPLDVTPRRTAYITGRHTVQGSIYHHRQHIISSNYPCNQQHLLLIKTHINFTRNRFGLNCNCVFFLYYKYSFYEAVRDGNGEEMEIP